MIKNDANMCKYIVTSNGNDANIGKHGVKIEYKWIKISYSSSSYL